MRGVGLDRSDLRCRQLALAGDTFMDQGFAVGNKGFNLRFEYTLCVT